MTEGLITIMKRVLKGHHSVHPHPEQTLAPSRARSMVRATVWERAAGFAFPWRSYNTDSPPQAQQPTLSPFTSGGIGRFVPDGGLPINL